MNEGFKRRNAHLMSFDTKPTATHSKDGKVPPRLPLCLTRSLFGKEPKSIMIGTGKKEEKLFVSQFWVRHSNRVRLRGTEGRPVPEIEMARLPNSSGQEAQGDAPGPAISSRWSEPPTGVPCLWCSPRHACWPCLGMLRQHGL